MSPALFLLAAMAATPEEADAPIAYQVKVLEMEGLGWRSALAGHLRRIERPGADAIWTGDRALAHALGRQSGRVVATDTVAARPEATAELVRGDSGPLDQLVRRVSVEGSDGTPSGDDLHVELTGRRLDQGVLAAVEVEARWVTATHAVPAAGVSTACGKLPATVFQGGESHEDAATDDASASDRGDAFVNEFAHARVVGEWLIPRDGVVVVSLGAHSAPGDDGKVVVRERLAVIEIVEDRAHAASASNECPAEGPVARPASLPPLPEDIDLQPAQDEACRVAEARGEAHPAKTGDATPAEDAPALSPTQVVEKADTLPIPSPPARSLPQGFTPEGQLAPPTKHDEGVKPTSSDESVEPRPTPQASPQSGSSAPVAPPSGDPGRDVEVPVESVAKAPDWQLTLPEAIRLGVLGVGRSGNAKVVHPGDEGRHSRIVIAAIAQTDPNQFKAEVMAMVRSIVQLYWDLGEWQRRALNLELATELAEEAVARSASVPGELGVPPTPGPTEAHRRLEALRRDLVEATAEVARSERQLRNILALKLDDPRRILPVSLPVESPVEPVWEDCLAAMNANQPDVLRSRTSPTGSGPKGNTPPAVHHATHQLARFYLAVKSDYREFQRAHRLAEETAQTLEARQASYQLGHATLGDYLDAIHTWNDAAAHEATTKTTYNTAITNLEEAQGTLLDREAIVLAGRREADASVRTASFETEEAPTAPVAKSFSWNLPLSGSRNLSIRVSASRTTRTLGASTTSK